MATTAEMDVVTTREPLVLDLAYFRCCRVIGIDGDNGTGKSTLAREINAALGGTIVSVDDFLLGNGQPYLSQVDFARLSTTLDGAAAPIIIEGVLLQDVLHRLGVSADYIVYAQCEHEGLTMHGASAEIEEYNRRRSPRRTAQLLVTLRIHFRH